MSQFIIDTEFEKYLGLVSLDPDKIPADQYAELQRAFTAGVSQFYLAILTNQKKLSPSEGAEFLSNLETQLRKFWAFQGIEI